MNGAEQQISNLRKSLIKHYATINDQLLTEAKKNDNKFIQPVGQTDFHGVFLNVDTNKKAIKALKEIISKIFGI